MRQGNDIGTQYRSIILTADDEQRAVAEASRDAYQAQLTAAGYGAITTEIAPAGPFYYAEDYHQQYLDKNPRGYCPNHSTGVKLPDDFVGHAAPVRRLRTRTRTLATRLPRPSVVPSAPVVGSPCVRVRPSPRIRIA